LLPHEEPFLTDQQLRDASIEQIEDLVQRINLVLQQRELPGVLVWRREAYEDVAPSADDDVSDPGVSL
jgi:hypothetical protein